MNEEDCEESMSAPSQPQEFTWSKFKPAIVYMGNTTIKAVLPPDIAIQFETCLTQTSYVKIYSFLLGIAGWIMCIISTTSVQWRLWHVENITSSTSEIIWIGIWKVCFMRDISATDDHDVMQCHIFSEKDSFIPIEIFLAQDLMTLAIIVEAMAILFLCLGFWNIYEDKGCKNLITQLFSVGSVLNLISGIVTLMPISWNMISILTEKTISFPVDFQLPDAPKGQAIGAGIYVGVVSAPLQILSGSFIFSEQCLSAGEKVHPKETSESQVITCPHCNSSLEIWKQNKLIYESTSSRVSHTDITEQFNISARGIRSRPFSNTDSDV